MKKLKILLLATLLSTATLFAGFSNVHCDNEGNLTTLNITQGDCQALEAFWDATGQGAGWTSQTDADTNNDWDRLDTAENWYGITLYENGGVKYFNAGNNNLTGKLPSELNSFTNAQNILIYQNHFFGEVPDVLLSKSSLIAINFLDNNFSGELPLFSNPNLIALILSNNHYTGSIPTEYGNLTKLENLLLDHNQLSGPLPDLSKLTALIDFRIGGNRFTFANMEPQIEFIKNVAHTSYGYQSDINETGHTVYFSDTLSIEPRLAANPSTHDYYIWKKDNAVIDDTRVYANEDYSASRIYTKTSATQADEGCYSYDVNNSRASRLNDGSIEFILHSNTCIQAIYDHAPVVSNPNPSLTGTEGVAYTYTSNISDTDNDDLTVTSLPLPTWLSLTANADSFTLSGTPSYTDAGSYDINITVTDGKVPTLVNYTLTVAQGLPSGFSASNGTFSHDSTHSSITADGTYPSVEEGNTSIELHSQASVTRAAYERLDNSGALSTGFYNNQPGTSPTPTLASSYPAGSKASIIPKPNSSNDDMIMVEIPLNNTTSITIGE